MTTHIVSYRACLCSLPSRLIRLSSPNLNYLIGGGAIILYVNTSFFVIPTTDPQVVVALCNLTPWLTALGYSLCYGTVFVKMVRVYFIFDKPTLQKKKVGHFNDFPHSKNIYILLNLFGYFLCVCFCLVFVWFVVFVFCRFFFLFVFPFCSHYCSASCFVSSLNHTPR